ncbi:MAG: SAM-dependent methyltransferase [Rhodospirillaceae bacterium]|nr:MAG: SAM-dependent methyltransferase [Rhodospirillaceae bacterium]
MRRCALCNGTAFRFSPVLWPKLIQEWKLAPHEAAHIDRQQGECCANCGANLRTIALAAALRAGFKTQEPLFQFIASGQANEISLLELNEAGGLHPLLERMSGHVFCAYPDVDMHALPFPRATFDFVVHSDTLEHVPNPVHALEECRRVLKPGGAVCYTVPVVVGRLSLDRQGLPKSYHGSPTETGDDYVVQTEFGADVWTYPYQAGFSEVRLHAIDYPAGLAISAYAT